MGTRRQLLYLLYTSSARPPSATPYFIGPPPPPFLFHKGYMHAKSNGNHVAHETINHERAPSTLEEFKRLEEEKASEGVVNQTVEKTEDGFMEAATGDGNVESVKESFKKPSGVDDTRRTGDFQNTK
ncbi:hypothetical protein M8C21_031300 [Ambrosia artemisiifolia]|uniref:Uncharacterized protein n=1 Tax=Ambrosia artemisiifolia TaxID=4212 RepID=A0AAD5G756_AMBAR|nr:hypothetical protein M8C21_031300 [Ambrosia artemisiifolia]